MPSRSTVVSAPPRLEAIVCGSAMTLFTATPAGSWLNSAASAPSSRSASSARSASTAREVARLSIYWPA